MLLNILGLVAGASFSGAFMFKTPYCYVAACVAALIVCYIRAH